MYQLYGLQQVIIAAEMIQISRSQAVPCMHGCTFFTSIANIFLTLSSTSLIIGIGLAIGTFRYSAPTSAMLAADAARTACLRRSELHPRWLWQQTGKTPLNGRAAEMQFVRSSCIGPGNHGQLLIRWTEAGECCGADVELLPNGLTVSLWTEMQIFNLEALPIFNIAS